MGLALSLTDFDLYALADLATLRFVGLDNYVRLLQTPLFWQALGNTLYFVAVGVPVSIGLSLGAALLLNARVAKWQGLFRTALFAPVVTTVVAVAVIWRYMLHTRYGLVNQALAAIGIDPVDWLGDPHWSMPAIILFAAWKNFGYNMVIFLAALQAIPRELYESARVDGAGPLRAIHRPDIADAHPDARDGRHADAGGLFPALRRALRDDAGRAAARHRQRAVLMYEEGFRWWNIGYASAVAFLLFVIIFAVSAGLLRFDRDRGPDEPAPRGLGGERPARWRRGAEPVPAALDAVGLVDAGRRVEHLADAAAAAG